MALIQCPYCGKQVSDKAVNCPHCGADLTKPKKLFCAECGAEIPAGAMTCPNCGWPVPAEMQAKVPVAGSTAEEKTEGPAAGLTVEAKAPAAATPAETQTKVPMAGSATERKAPAAASSAGAGAGDAAADYAAEQKEAPTPSGSAATPVSTARQQEAPQNTSASAGTGNDDPVLAAYRAKKKKKRITNIIIIAFIAALVLGITGLIVRTNHRKEPVQQKISRSGSDKKTKTDTKDQPTRESVQIKPSPDKYTWYIKDYVGLNLANVGYQSLGKDIFDQYGEGLVQFRPVTTDGTFVDPSDDTQLKNYVVKAQNVEPNSELKYVYGTDANGNENDKIAWQTYEEIDLLVERISGDSGDTIVDSLTPLNPKTDLNNTPVRNYVGKNLGQCGYTSLGGSLMDKYTGAVVELNLVTDDGSYLDPEDEELLHQYYVTGQNVEPNTNISIQFNTTEGDYSNFDVASQSIEQINLNVSKLSDKTISLRDDEKQSISDDWAELEYVVVSLHNKETNQDTVIAAGRGLVYESDDSSVEVKDAAGKYWANEYFSADEKGKYEVKVDKYGKGHKNVSVLLNGNPVASGEDYCVDGGLSLLNVYTTMGANDYAGQEWLKDGDVVSVEVTDL